MTQASSTTNGNQHTRAVYLDMEWTCWDTIPPHGMKQEIIEIGVVAMNLNDLEILDETSYFVRPRRWEISLKCTQLTGITHEDVLSARSLIEVLDAVSTRFQPQDIPCCTWGDDFSILAKACKLAGFASPFRRSIDLSLIVQGAFALRDCIGLKSAIDLLELDFDGFAHGALPDAKNTARVHQALLRRLRNKSETETPVKSHNVATNSLSPFALKLRHSLSKDASE